MAYPRRTFLSFLFLVTYVAVAASASAESSVKSASRKGLYESPQGFGSNPWYYAHWCGVGDGNKNLTWLFDMDCQKKFPSSFSREWSCPTISSEVPKGYFPDGPISELEIDHTTLASIPSLLQVNMSLIIIKRTQKGAFYKYFDNGLPQIPIYTCSSSKIFTAASGAGQMENVCEFGLDALATGKHGPTPLGDLLTIICSYDSTANYTSNSLAKYFGTVSGRQRLWWLIHSWLDRTKNESLGGSYSEAKPPDLEFTFTDPETGAGPCNVTPGWRPNHHNYLTTFSMSEMLRRLALHRDVLPPNQFPNITWEDVKNILYGAEESLLFPGLKWGGMSSDIAIYTQSALDMDKVEANGQGKWRIFSKLGNFYSTIRGSGEVTNVYACLPVLDKNGVPVPNKGYEFVLSAGAQVAQDYSYVLSQNVLHKAVVDLVQTIVKGNL